MKMADTKILRDINFFADFSDKELKLVADIVEKKEFKTGDTIFKDSDDGTGLFIIRKGEVKACKTTPDGELFTLMMMKDGDIFGEMSFLDGRPRSATIIAITDVETYVLEKANFDTLIEKHPMVIYKLMRNIVFTIHSIVRGMNTRYVEMMNYMFGRKR